MHNPPFRPTQLAQRIANLAESATIAMAQRSRELQAQGKDIINLSLGEPDFDTPAFIREAAKAALDAGYTRYTPVAGFLDVREAVVRKFQRDNQLSYRPQEIVLSTGAKQSIANVVFALTDPGDEVILPAPFWVSYSAMVALAEGKPVVVPTTIQNDYKITPEQLAEVLTPRSRLLIFSSPCNPSGSVYTREELAALAEVIRTHERLFAISDEIYEHINFTDQHASMASMPGMMERTATVNGLSKAYAMTGWRLGYLGAPQAVADACTKYQGQLTSGPNSMTQRAVIAALDGDQSETQAMKAAFLRRRDFVGAGLADVPGWKTNVPQGAFYHFPNISAWFGRQAGERVLHNADDVAMYLLEEAGVALVSGAAFGAPDCLRLSYAASDEQLQEALRRIQQAAERLQAAPASQSA